MENRPLLVSLDPVNHVTLTLFAVVDGPISNTISRPGVTITNDASDVSATLAPLEA
jgi:hypothetical protein